MGVLTLEVDPVPTVWTIGWRAVLYLIINSAQPLLVDFIKYEGAATVTSFLYIMPTYYGMILVGAFNNKSIFSHSRHTWLTAFRLCSADFTHQLLEKAGLIFCGSAVYMVCSSTSIAFTALISWWLLGNRSSFTHCVGIACIFIGLSCRVGQFQFSHFYSADFIGVTLILCASVLHALAYVWNEGALTGPYKIGGTELVCMMGLMSSTLLTLWTFVYTLPQINALVLQPVAEKGGSLKVAMVCWLLLLLCAFVRSMTLWYLLKHVGAVTSGVIKGARAVMVIGLSHMLFCSFDSRQCLNMPKSMAAAVCVVGVFIYSMSPSPQPFAAYPRDLEKDGGCSGEREALSPAAEHHQIFGSTETSNSKILNKYRINTIHKEEDRSIYEPSQEKRINKDSRHVEKKVREEIEPCTTFWHARGAG